MSEHGENVSVESPDKQHIPRKNKRKNTLETSIKEKKVFKYHTTQLKGQSRILYLM